MNGIDHKTQSRYWGLVEERFAAVESVMFALLVVSAVAAVLSVTFLASLPVLLVGCLVLAVDVLLIAWADRRREGARFLRRMHGRLSLVVVA